MRVSFNSPLDALASTKQKPRQRGARRGSRGCGTRLGRGGRLCPALGLCRRGGLGGAHDQRLSRHTLGQHYADDAFVVFGMPNAVRDAQAVPQAVRHLVLAQPGRLGDAGYCVFARQRGGADAGQRSIRDKGLELAELDWL